jgi:hypothetical protein
MIFRCLGFGWVGFFVFAGCQQSDLREKKDSGSDSGVVETATVETPSVPFSDPLSDPFSGPTEAISLSTFQKGALRVGTWNLEHLQAKPGRGAKPRTLRDFQRMRDYGESLQFDVLAVQEVVDVAALERVFSASTFRFELSQSGGAMRCGFVIRKGISFVRHPDVEALSLGGRVRPGVDLEIRSEEKKLRLLAVHLKSGCFDDASGHRQACEIAERQRPLLEAWSDARVREGIPFIVLGDFNRRFRSGDSFWESWDDGEPAGLDLALAGEGSLSECRDGRYPDFIDHLVFDARAVTLARPGSWRQWNYSGNDWKRYKLSDHCALTIDLHSDFKASPVSTGAPGLSTNTPTSAASSSFSSAAAASTTSETSIHSKGKVSSNTHFRIRALLPNPPGDDAMFESLRLKNTGNVAATPQGWRLRDAAGALWNLSGAGSLEPGKERVLQRQGQPLSLNNRGDRLALINAQGDTVQALQYGSVREGEWVEFP